VKCIVDINPVARYQFKIGLVDIQLAEILQVEVFCDFVRGDRDHQVDTKFRLFCGAFFQPIQTGGRPALKNLLVFNFCLFTIDQTQLQY